MHPVEFQPLHRFKFTLFVPMFHLYTKAMVYKEYLIKNSDDFQADQFPQITEDLEEITRTMAGVAAVDYADMLLSVCKGHGMKAEWENAHPGFAEKISTQSLPVKNLEALFDSCNKNPGFERQFEAYIRMSLKA